MIIETMKGSIEYDITVYTGIVTKVEKWNSINTTTTTNVTSGGGKVQTGWDGKVNGKIDPINISTTQTNNSTVNTRLYFDDGSSITLENCDVITTEGNEIQILLYAFQNNTYPIKVVDKFTNFEHKIMDFQVFFSDVLGLKRSSLKFNLILSLIGVGIMTGLYFLLKSWVFSTSRNSPFLQ